MDFLLTFIRLYRFIYIKSECKMLNHRQSSFVDEYIACGNGAQAAIRAGYSPNSARETAYELLTKPHISAELAARQAVLAEEVAMSRERVVAALLEAVEMAKAQGDTRAMIAGWKELARLCGLYPTKEVVVSLPEVNPRPMSQWSDAELLAVIHDGKTATTLTG